MVNLDRLTERYRKKIRIDPLTGCWLWTGAKSSNGRGCVYVCGHTLTTHKFFFELFIGPVPDGLELHHKCEVAACCNPDHLEIKTRLQHRRIHPDRRFANREKTHCKNGHPLEGENLYLEIRDGHPRRHCQACRKATMRAFYLQRKESQCQKIASP